MFSVLRGNRRVDVDFGAKLNAGEMFFRRISAKLKKNMQRQQHRLLSLTSAPSKRQKHTTVGIPPWSPTGVLIHRSEA